MSPARVVVLAGHRRSLATVAMLRALAATPAMEVVKVVGVLSVRELSVRRLRAWRKRFGRGLWRRIGRELRRSDHGSDPEQRVFLDYLAGTGGAGTVPGVCREYGVPFHVVPSLNADKARSFVRERRADYGIYTGGGILRRPLLEAFAGGVLNVHSGPLPHVRGMTAVEWSLFHGLTPTATLHRIDEGIDTGGIYGSRAVVVEQGDTLESLRARTVLTGIELLAELLPAIAEGRLEPRPNPAGKGRQYFAMVGPLKEIVQQWIDDGRTPMASAEDVEPGDLRTALQRGGR